MTAPLTSRSQRLSACSRACFHTHPITRPPGPPHSPPSGDHTATVSKTDAKWTSDRETKALASVRNFSKPPFIYALIHSSLCQGSLHVPAEATPYLSFCPEETPCWQS